MADERTTEQRAADNALRDAVMRVAEVYADDTIAGWVLTDYLLVYATQGWDDEGDASSAVGTAVDADTSPIYRLLGLADVAATRYRAMLLDDE